MKIIFLDVDGVLNCDSTKERITGRGALIDGFMGIDRALLERFLNWLDGMDAKIVLSSSWRSMDAAMEELVDHGVSWVDVTPRLGVRGFEISSWLDCNPVDSYVIIDDVDQFFDEQKDRLVLTDPKVGITKDDLIRAETILSASLPSEKAPTA